MKRLMQLMQANRQTENRHYKVDASASTDEATIYLYDVIGLDWWTGGGITAKQFAADMSAITAGTIHLRFNSPGGDVFEARAMVSAIQQHPSKVVAHIDGLAASAASFLAMHADEIEITDGAFFMIHNGWTVAVGNRHAMLDMAAMLEQIDSAIVDDYHVKTKIDQAEIARMMDAETWINASDAVSMGFADRIAVSKKDAKAQARADTWDLSAYAHAPTNITSPAASQAANDELAEQEAAHADRMRRFALVAGSRA